jgi:hypothetical protein
MTAEEINELLRKVRLRGERSFSHRVLNDEERAAIAGVLLPEINRRLLDAARGTQHETRMPSANG